MWGVLIQTARKTRRKQGFRAGQEEESAMEGQRVAKKEGGGKLPWIITGTVVGVLAAAYIGVCAWASGREAILPNVSVAGVDVSNMSAEQAHEVVKTAVEDAGRDIDFTLAYEGVSRTLNAGSLAVDVEQSVSDAQQIGHENFLTAGFQLASHMLGASSQVPLALEEGDQSLDGFLTDMEKAVAAASEDHPYQIEGDKLVMTKGAPIAMVDWEQVRADTQEALQEAYVQRISQKKAVQRELALSAQQGNQEEPDFDAIHREVYTEPKDASLDLESMEITDHTVGVDFDVQELKRAYSAAKGGETFSIPVTLTQPKVTKEDLGGRLFADLLGEATSQVGGVASRLYNVSLSASSCNDVILLPGEVFSYNDTTGPRSVANGYKLGSVYVGGRSEMQPGGGVCQTSSTLYHAILHTTLEIVERRCHQFAVGYVPDGMDATVYDGGTDFKFRNNTDYPIQIKSWTYDNSKGRFITVQIYGTNLSGRYAVPSASTFDWVSPTTVYVPKEGVERGSMVQDREQYAYHGRKAHT